MVERVLEPRWRCNGPGCGRLYDDEQTAIDCENKGLIGPNLFSGLVLGRSTFLSPMLSTDSTGKVVNGLPKMRFYVLTKELEPVRHQRVYHFLDSRFEGYDRDNNVGREYVSGVNHKWLFYSKKLSSSKLFYSEKDSNYRGNGLLGSDITRLGDLRIVSNDEFERFLNFVKKNKNAVEFHRELRKHNLGLDNLWSDVFLLKETLAF